MIKWFICYILLWTQFFINALQQPIFNYNINQRLREYTCSEMSDICRTMLRLNNRVKSDQTKEAKEAMRKAYEHLQRTSHRKMQYLGWSPFYSETNAMYKTPFYFVFFEEIGEEYLYLEQLFQNPVWFEIGPDTHINIKEFMSDIEKLADVYNMTLNTDKLAFIQSGKFKLALTMDDWFY